MIYTVSNARRILGSLWKNIKIQTWWKVVWVVAEGKRPTLVSKKRFLQAFVDFRKQQSRQLEVTRNLVVADRYTVRNPVKESTYQVQLGEAIACGCEDFAQQIEAFGKGCCKHLYATLNTLGFSSLNEYIAQK